MPKITGIAFVRVPFEIVVPSNMHIGKVYTAEHQAVEERLAKNYCGPSVGPDGDTKASVIVNGEDLTFDKVRIDWSVEPDGEKS
jgi:hypothetical protein